MSSITFRRVVDLSAEISPDTQMFPAYPQPSFVQWTTRDVHGFLAEAMFLATHTASHVDAPWHCLPEGRRIHEYPASRFIVRARLLDLRPQRGRGRIAGRTLTRALRGRPLARGEAVVLRTGWESRAGRPAYLHDNPGLTPDGARRLVSWGASIVGIDTANIDHPEAPRLSAHEILLDADILVLENLANLGAIRAHEFTLVALPLRLRGASGSPIRAVALV